MNLLHFFLNKTTFYDTFWMLPKKAIQYIKRLIFFNFIFFYFSYLLITRRNR